MFIITYVYLKYDIKDLTFYIYTWFSFKIVFIQNIIFLLEQTVLHVLQTFQTD